MKTAQSQFTLRALMALVALVAVTIPMAGIIVRIAGEICQPDDIYFLSQKKLVYEWDAGQSPCVELDLDEGSINVVQSTNGRVTAVLTPYADTKKSQAAADAALGDITIAASHERDTIRIKTTRAPKPWVRGLRADIELRVPSDASLSLLTSDGNINIGKSWGGPSGADLIVSPVALKSVKAKESGNIFVGIYTHILRRTSLPATSLDLESRHGPIDIKGDHVLVKAKALGGAIEYVGCLAPGIHHFETGPYVPHDHSGWQIQDGIKLILPADSAFDIEASSVRGNVSSDFHHEATISATRHFLKGPAGVDPRIRLELVSDDGPILVLRNHGEKPGCVASENRSPKAPAN